MNFSLQTEPAAPTPPPQVADLPSYSQAKPRRRRWGALKAAAVAAAVAGAGAVAVIGVPGIKRPLSGLFASTRREVITVPVKPGKLSVIVKEKGSIESANNKDVVVEVEGGTTIISIKPEGTKVKEGDIVCELDSAALRDSLNTQKISTSQAEASYEQSKLTREVAEVAVVEYIEGLYKQEISTNAGEKSLAESDLERAIDRHKWSSRMLEKGYVSISSNIADKLSVDKAKFELEKAQTAYEVLTKYTKEKTIKELRSEVEKARADELSKASVWALEKTKEAKLIKQINACILKAPADGIVVYANDPNRFGGQNQLQIEEGASVRERQKIFSLPDISKMRVNTKVHESMVDRIKPGLRALIRVDAAANQVLRGRVSSVAPMADPNSMFSSDIKVYTTQIAIESDASALNLRPGMTAQVEILVTELDDVLSVPVMSILEYKGKDYVFIRKGEEYKRVEVTPGVSNDQHVEIKKGLISGDQVALTPLALLSEDERREAFSVAERDAAKKDWGAEGPPAAKGAGPGAEGGDGASAKGKAKGKRGGGGGMGAMGALFQNMSEEDRGKLRTASPEERISILKKAGATDAQIEQMQQMGGGGGGGGEGGGRRRGGGGEGGGGGGFGGGGPGQ
ncbi:efflux RND transporter periplasmic adaptor subunit [Tundrisphaera sp. TA3]|uniref:efflux RND transporter periplasmic adaptor subunit n=1 Tax=Tundrisphaera sp. TA3 TaxID=3435775 RepID=UPI003EBB97B0